MDLRDLNDPTAPPRNRSRSPRADTEETRVRDLMRHHSNIRDHVDAFLDFQDRLGDEISRLNSIQPWQRTDHLFQIRIFRGYEDEGNRLLHSIRMFKRNFGSVKVSEIEEIIEAYESKIYNISHGIIEPLQYKLHIKILQDMKSKLYALYHKSSVNKIVQKDDIDRIYIDAKELLARVSTERTQTTMKDEYGTLIGDIREFMKDLQYKSKPMQRRRSTTKRRRRTGKKKGSRRRQR